MSGIVVSVVIPCLNESESLRGCILEALQGLDALGVPSEVLVSDNGSSDGSVGIAESCGARVVHAKRKGYGGALRFGIESAHGKFVVMGDADGSYDFSDLSDFYSRLVGGAEMVIGNRFSGGIEEGAMPWKNRYIGNPLLSLVGRLLFHSRIRDWHCGIRAIRKDSYALLGLNSTGMEFASEMVAKASYNKLVIAEVDVSLRKDKRSRTPHLRPWRDGLRHLRFLILYRFQTLFD